MKSNPNWQTARIAALRDVTPTATCSSVPTKKQENKRICACVSRVVGRITLDNVWREEIVS